MRQHFGEFLDIHFALVGDFRELYGNRFIDQEWIVGGAYLHVVATEPVHISVFHITFEKYIPQLAQLGLIECPPFLVGKNMQHLAALTTLCTRYGTFHLGSDGIFAL